MCCPFLQCSSSTVGLCVTSTSVSLRCYFGYVLPIPEYCSPVGVWGSATECHLQPAPMCEVYSVARICPDKSLLSLCHLRNLYTIFFQLGPVLLVLIIIIILLKN